jgi:hypothetical protein
MTDDTNVQETALAEVERAAALAPVKQAAPPTPTPAQARQRGSKGGRNARAVALIGLGSPLPVVSLKTAADRLSVLEATLAAVAEGKTSGMVAQTIVTIVRAAGETARHDADEQLQELERRVQELTESRTITMR